MYLSRKRREQAEDRREDHKPKFIQPQKEPCSRLVKNICNMLTVSSRVQPSATSDRTTYRSQKQRGSGTSRLIVRQRAETNKGARTHSGFRLLAA